MPKWGLTESQRESLPWGLAKDWLEPGKTVTDAVHGDVYVTELEQAVLDSPPMQRLRRVRQLGTTHLVYPSATHSRFSHALGTMRAAQDLLDAVVTNRAHRRAGRDLFDSWRRAGEADHFDRRFAEATVLARLGALLHDFCHVPLGHTVEDDLGVLDAHDANGPRFDLLWRAVPAEVRTVVEEADGGALLAEVRRLVLSKEEPPEGWKSRYPFVGDIVGNTICADLIDYIRRDHSFTGLPLALGDRFIDDFYVTPADLVRNAERMVVRITRDGHRRVDIVSELLKYLRYRYELSERVLTHHAKTAADAMLGKLLEMWSDALWVDVALRRDGGLADDPGTDDIAIFRGAVGQRFPPPAGAPAGTPSPVVEQIDAEVKRLIEHEFVTRSDDGLLEHLFVVNDESSARDGRRRGVARLARKVLDRDLFKVLGRAEGAADRALAQEIHDEWGDKAKRNDLERRAADVAGIRPRWRLLLWVPSPRMRLKVAEVLVDVDGKVATLAQVDDNSEHIVESHRALWAITVYSDVDAREENLRTDIALAFIAEELDVAMVRHDGMPVPRLAEITARTVAKHARLGLDDVAALVPLVGASPSGSAERFEDLARALFLSAKAAHVVPHDLDPPGDWFSVTGDGG